MIRAARFRALAGALEGAIEVPHMERTAWRTKARIFATVAPDERSVNLKLDLEAQERWCEARPEAFRPVPGGWGRMGMTTVELARVDEVDLVAALGDAHALARPKPKPRPKPR